MCRFARHRVLPAWVFLRGLTLSVWVAMTAVGDLPSRRDPRLGGSVRLVQRLQTDACAYFNQMLALQQWASSRLDTAPGVRTKIG